MMFMVLLPALPQEVLRMTEALGGVRVLDLTQGMAGPLATMILADFGAEVIRVEPLGGDPMWSQPAYLLWNRGKKSIELDLASQHTRALIRGVDVLVESLHPGEADRRGIGYVDAAELNPQLVYFSISAFGQEGPYRALKPYDGIVNAKSGRMRDQLGWYDNRPIYRAVNDTSYHTAMTTVQGILAALRVASITGRGQRVDTRLLQGVTAPNNPWRRFEGEELPPVTYPGHRRECDIRTAYPAFLCTECKDGRWIMHAHTQANLFRTWIRAIGFEWIWDDPRFQGAPDSFLDDADRIALNELIVARMKDRTSAEWMALYVDTPDCCGEVMQTTQEVLQHPQFIHNGHLVEIDDPRVGRMKQVGAFVHMSETPAVVRTPAPFPGQHTAEVLSAVPRQRAVAQPTGPTPRRPLEGVLTLELAAWLAAPFSGALLADLGARVIKIEPLAGDPYRAMEGNENMIRTTQGKQSIALDLKSVQGQEILHKLLARADALMHNFRPDVPPRLGLGYETARAVNPSIVYLYAGSYGSTGSHSRRAAFNPTMGALTGNSVFQSGEGNVPLGDQSADPIAGSSVATALMLGLAARWRTGKGQYMETTMMNSIVYCNSDDAFDYGGKPPRRNPDELQLGLQATYRLYQALEGWVFLAVPHDDEFAAFCAAAGCDEFVADPRFASEALRYDNRVALGEELEPVFSRHTATEWESRLTAADVGCVVADGPGHKRFLHEDPHASATGFMVPTQHPLFASSAPGGTYWRHAPVISFSDTPCEPGLPFVALGEHTRQIMQELDYSDQEVSQLEEARVIRSAASGDTLVAASS
jgi:crotonobetainyl-CoA:carnitine CoA-transferase CaiB-like acyl-CoA transferase